VSWAEHSGWPRFPAAWEYALPRFIGQPRRDGASGSCISTDPGL